LKPSATAPISSVLTTGARPSRRPCSTSAIAASTSFKGPATLLAAKRARPTATTTPTPTKNRTVERSPDTIPRAVAGSASSKSSPRTYARMPSTASGTTAVSRKMASRRTRTARRGTRGTALRSPAGKRSGRRCRQICSLTKKMKAVVTLPASTLTPKTTRTPSCTETFLPIKKGMPKPDMRPATTQPAKVTPAKT